MIFSEKQTIQKVMVQGLGEVLEKVRRREDESNLVMSCHASGLTGETLEPSKLASQALNRYLIPEGELPEDEENFQREQEAAIASLQTQLKEQQEQVKAGNLSCLEEVLVNQLNLLNLMFLDSSMKLNSAISEGYLLKEHTSAQVQRLADFTLKLQNQTVKTARVITDLKKPRQTTFIKKYVSQQLNQLIADQRLQLGESQDAPLDIGSQRETVTVNQKSETLD